VLLGSDRPVSLTEPVADLGLGLDSLGLVEFVVALEKTFHVQFPDTVWTHREQLTVQSLVDFILASNAVASPVVQAPPLLLLETGPADVSKWAKLVLAVRERGVWRGLLWAASRFFARVLRLVYERQTYFIVEFDLSRQPLREYAAPEGVVLRELTAADAGALQDFWNKEPDKSEMGSFRERPDGDYIRLGAWSGGELVGIDWLSGAGHDAHKIRLRIRTRPGSCWGQGLYEGKMYQGKGVGLALLARSLTEAQRRGYERQVTYVAATNARMLSATIHLLGFKKIGHIQTTWILRRPYSSWQVGEESGRGGTVVV